MSIKTCRICLALDVKVSTIGNTEAKCFIENIFKQNGYRQDIHGSNFICYECKALLNKSYSFIRRVLRAQDILFQMVKGNKMITSFSLKQINRRNIGLNLVRDFKHIDFHLIEDESKFYHSIKTENVSVSDVQCKIEVDDSRIDPLESPGDDTSDDFDRKETEIDFGYRLNYDWDFNKRDIKVPNLEFSGINSVNDCYSFEPVHNDLYEFDESILIEAVKEEIDESHIQITGMNKKNKMAKRICIKKEKHGKDSPKKKPPDAKKLKKVTSIKERPRRQRKTKISKNDDSYYYDDSGRRIKKPEIPKYPAKCEHCTFEVLNRTAHFHHYLLEHKDKKYPHALTGKFVCQFCGLVSKTKWRHQNHEYTHSTETNFSCSQCPKRFVNKHRLQKHTYRTHPLKMFECDYCGKKLKSRESLMIHIRIHTGERPFKCPHCGAGFAHRGNIRPHIRANHEQADTGTDIKSKRKIKYEMKDFVPISYESDIGKLSGADLFMNLNTVINKF